MTQGTFVNHISFMVRTLCDERNQIYNSSVPRTYGTLYLEKNLKIDNIFIHSCIHTYVIKNKAFSICVYFRNLSIFKAFKMNPSKRSTFLFKYKEPQINNLKELNSKITPIKRIDFMAAHGDMLIVLI